MYTSGLAFGLVLIPLGYYLMIEGGDVHARVVGNFSIAVGIILFLTGWIQTIRQERKSREDTEKKFDELISELRGLRRDLDRTTKEDRGGKDGK
jgi:hypothetical protein